MKKVLISLMCIIMVVCFMPTVAMAGKMDGCFGGESCTHKAAIGNIHYDTLAEAVGEVPTDGTETTITMLKSEKINDFITVNNKKNIVLDLNNCDITHDGYFVFKIYNAKFHVTGTGSIIENVVDGYAPILAGGSGTDVKEYTVVTVDSGVTLKGDYSGIFTAKDAAGGNKNYGLVINIAGTIDLSQIGKVDAPIYGHGVYINGSNNNTEGNVPVYNLQGMRILEGAGTGIYAAGYAQWILDDVSIVADDALSLKAGIFTINGGNYTSKGEYNNPGEDTSNGSVDTGAALSLTSNDGYAHKVDVTVNGGTFTSSNGHAVYEGIPNQKGTSTPVAAHSYVTLAINDGSFISATGKDSVSLTAMDNKKVVTGGRFSSDACEYKVGNKYCSKESSAENAMYLVHDHNTTCNFGHTYCPATCKDANGAEMCHTLSHYVAPPIPPTTPTDNVTNSGTAGTDNATTSADLSGSTSTSNGTTTSTVDKTTADKIVDKAVENKSEEIVIDATANSTTAANSTTTAQVTIPTDTLGAIAEKTEADVTIKTDVAEVKLDNASAAAVADQAEGDTVQIIAEKVKEDATEVHFELKVVCSDGKVISDFKGGNVAVTVALPKAMADKKVVCVYIDDNGHMSKMEGKKNADGTYTFNTGHFSSYAIMAEEEADAAIAAQKEAIKNIKIKLTSKQVKTKAGKKAVKIAWTAAAGDKVLDGVEVYRSTERYKGYGTEPFYTSTKGGNTGSYTNTKSLKKGTKYYYRVRGYVLVDGQKVYTDYSTKAWRTVK